MTEEDEVFIFGDYSQQEPRILAYVTLDEGMLQAYNEGKRSLCLCRIIYI